MPASVDAANPTAVLPYSSAVSFRQRRAIIVNQNRYPDATAQSLPVVDSSRKSWVTTRRATAAQLLAIRDFFVAMAGGKPFYFYDVYETEPIFSYDPTGTAVIGRYVVRFDGPYQQSLDWGRNPVQYTLIELD